MTEKGSIYLSAKCRDCKKRTLDGAAMSMDYTERRIAVDRNIEAKLVLTSTAIERPLTVGIDLSYEDRSTGQITMWHSYRCEDPPCLVAVLRAQAHDIEWYEKGES